MPHRRAVALMVLVTLLWSIAGVVTRHLDAARSFEVTFWRSLFTALTLAVALTVLRGPALWSGLLRANRWLWLSGLCWATMFTAFMLALTLTSVANVLVTMALGPLATAVFARLFLHHPLPARTWAAIVAACLGIAWMFGGEAGDGLARPARWSPVRCRWRRRQLDGAPARRAGRRQRHAAGGAGRRRRLGAADSPARLAVAGIGARPRPAGAARRVQLALPCLLVVRLTRVLPAPEIALLALLEVIFGVAWAWLWAGEQPSPRMLAGGLLVLAALVANQARVSSRR